MNARQFVTSASAIVALTASAGALAQDTPGPTCGDFTVYIENELVEFFDIGDPGVSAGDRRIGRYEILDGDGNMLGHFLFSATILPASHDGQFQVLGTGRYEMSNGSIVTSMVYELADPSDTATGAVLEFVYPVIGGMGDYAGVHGIVRSATDAQGRRAQMVDLACDE